MDSSTAEKLVVLLTGKSGAGKSSLANAILGTTETGMVATEGDFTVRTDGGGVTRKVYSYKVSREGVEITVIDSPGLQDLGYEELSDEKIVQSIQAELDKETKSQLDLVLYCLPMNTHRLDIADAEAIKHLTTQFGQSIWNKTVFILTFANSVRIPGSVNEKDPDAVGEYFKQCISGFKDALSKALGRANCPKEISDGIVVVPAGYHTAGVQDIFPEDPWKLPQLDDWFSNLWIQCATRLDGKEFNAIVVSQKSRFRLQDAMVNNSTVACTDAVPAPSTSYSERIIFITKGGLESILTKSKFAYDVIISAITNVKTEHEKKE